MLVVVDTIDEDKVDTSEYKSLKKIGNKIVEILAKSKSWNLLKFKFVNFFKFKNVQSTSIIKKFNLLTLNIRVSFTKFR